MQSSRLLFCQFLLQDHLLLQQGCRQQLMSHTKHMYSYFIHTVTVYIRLLCATKGWWLTGCQLCASCRDMQQSIFFIFFGQFVAHKQIGAADIKSSLSDSPNESPIRQLTTAAWEEGITEFLVPSHHLVKSKRCLWAIFLQSQEGNAVSTVRTVTTVEQ